MLRIIRYFITALGVACCMLCCNSRLLEADEVSYQTDIQPLLLEKCGECHSENTRKADLSLANAIGFAKGGEFGELIVPHEPAIYIVQSGKMSAGRPTLGSWVTYGLGSECEDLPEYIVLDDPLGLPVNGV